MKSTIDTFCAAALWVAAVGGVCAAEVPDLTAPDIVTKAYKVDSGRDSISRLTFLFQKPNGTEKKYVYTMLWKVYEGPDDLTAKTLFFSEYPPDDRGKSFMAWLYGHKMDDHWLYLPELRMVRKISHGAHQHMHDDDEFGNSDLTRADMVPRDPALDTHTLEGEEEVGGEPCYIVDSVPKKIQEDYPYRKVRRWFTKSAFLPVRADYYGEAGEVEKRQTTTWKNINGAWVWEETAATHLRLHTRTLLTITDIRLNAGLGDELFTTRRMTLGLDAALGR